jgi:hypothetical protein
MARKFVPIAYKQIDLEDASKPGPASSDIVLVLVALGTLVNLKQNWIELCTESTCTYETKLEKTQHGRQ